MEEVLIFYSEYRLDSLKTPRTAVRFDSAPYSYANFSATTTLNFSILFSTKNISSVDEVSTENYSLSCMHQSPGSPKTPKSAIFADYARSSNVYITTTTSSTFAF